MKAAWLAVPARAAACCFAMILAGGFLAQFVPPGWQGNWADHVVRNQAHFVDRFFPFDAVWYQHIATDWYVWDSTQPHVKQDVAFFPLWPAVLWVVSALVSSPSAARWMTVGLSACFGFASIAAFYRLALRVLARRDAETATWLFALYPGASFLLLSYPTGLMNLLCICALLAAMDRRYWAACACAGAVTASGPLGLGTAMAVWGCAAFDAVVLWRDTKAIAAALLRLGLLGFLSISGLIAFLALQYVRFGDMAAFIKAQGAWSTPPPWGARILPAIWQVLIVPDFGLSLAYAVHSLHMPNLVAVQAELEKGVHYAALGFALLALAVCLRVAPRPLKFQGVFTMALFMAFHSTVRPGNSTLRLIYCVMTSFVGLAWLLRGRPRVAPWAIGVSAVLLGCGAFLSAAGYHVT